MNTRISNIINLLLYTGVAIIILLAFFAFWNLSSEFYETPKFIAISIITLILLVLWSIKFAVEGKTTLLRTPLDLPLLLLLGIFLISTIFASSRPIAIMGNLPRINGGLASFIIYIAIYFIFVSNIKQTLINKFTYLLIISGTILSVMSLLSFTGNNILPLSWTSALNFTPTGSTFSTTAILSLLLPFPIILILRGNGIENLEGKKQALNKTFKNIIFTLIATLFLAAIVLTGSLATYLAAAAVLILALFTTSQKLLKKGVSFLIIPIAITIILAIFSFLPIGGSKNILYTKAQNFPREIQLPFATSWKISVSAFRDSPFWGTGPGSYLFNFTSLKPLEFNNNKYWNLRFDQPYNEYLGFLATLGLTGFIALLLLTFIFMSLAFKSLASTENSFVTPLAISGIVFFIILAFHASTLPFWVIGMVILSFFAVTKKRQSAEVEIDITTPSNKNNFSLTHFNILPIIILLVIAGLVLFGGYLIIKAAMADYYHRQALDAVVQNQRITAYNALAKAERLNPNIDSYRRDIALVNFDIANTIAVVKGPSESSPAGNLTDSDKQQIQTYLSQAIAEGRTAATLNPNNPANWELLGSIYQQISGVAQNAVAFSLDSYGKAIQYDPFNPYLRITVGGIYYSVKNYDLAIRFFTDAINLKPDYANAYYNLAVVLKDKGDLQNAIASAEKTISLVDPKSNDYKTATTLLADLKSKAEATASGKEASGLKTPSDNNKSAGLQNKKLPKVLDLPKPGNISTPAAVKKETPQE